MANDNCRDADRAAEAGEADLGRAEDQGAARAALSGCAQAGDLDGACGARPSRAGASAARGGATGRRERRSRRPASRTTLWCADYKGEFMLADRRYCYPLTITDFASRYLIACEALSHHQGGLRLHRVRERLQGVRPARAPSAPTTACPSPAPMRSSTCRGCRCGGSGSASTSSASSPATRSRTAVTSACT